MGKAARRAVHTAPMRQQSERVAQAIALDSAEAELVKLVGDLQEAQNRLQTARRAVIECAGRLHRGGASWRELAPVVGVSHVALMGAARQLEASRS